MSTDIHTARAHSYGPSSGLPLLRALPVLVGPRLDLLGLGGAAVREVDVAVSRTELRTHTCPTSPMWWSALLAQVAQALVPFHWPHGPAHGVDPQTYTPVFFQHHPSFYLGARAAKKFFTGVRYSFAISRLRSVILNSFRGRVTKYL